MLARNYKQRGGPIYVGPAGATITLVPEVRVRERRLGSNGTGNPSMMVDVSPSGLYVIDANGVRKIAIRDETERALAAMLLVALAVFALSWLVIRRGAKWQT